MKTLKILSGVLAALLVFAGGLALNGAFEKPTQPNLIILGDLNHSTQETTIERVENILRCDWGYSEEYRCSDSTLEREWVSSDCSSEWLYSKMCSYGCEGGECTDKPIINTEQEEPIYPICSSNVYNCADFDTQSEAQIVMTFCSAISGQYDIHWLDGDMDGIACEPYNEKSNLNFGLLG